jgi:hypothetical protein
VKTNAASTLGLKYSHAKWYGRRAAIVNVLFQHMVCVMFDRYSDTAEIPVKWSYTSTRIGTIIGMIVL